MAKFTRFTETIDKKSSARVVSITVKPVVIDCTGFLWITDMMLQEGGKLTGFVIHTDTQLRKQEENGVAVPKRFYNGLVRSAATCVIFNLGSTAAGLDYKIYPNQAMSAESVSLSLGAGAHKATFKEAANTSDELSLLASTRECLKNGTPTAKDGFFQYSAAGDSKHPITVEDTKSARIYVEFQEMQDGDDSL